MLSKTVKASHLSVLGIPHKTQKMVLPTIPPPSYRQEFSSVAARGVAGQ